MNQRHAVTTDPGWLWRALASIGLVTTRELPPDPPGAGSDFIEDHGVGPGYSVAMSMSAYAGLPWVYACVTALAEDSASLPRKIVRGRGSDAEVLESHELLDLFAQPSQRVDGYQFDSQQIVDRVLSGNAFSVLVGPPNGKPASRIRLHPNRVEIVPRADGTPDYYLYDDRRRYDWDAVLHIRGASWEDGPERLWGQGVIRALHDTLNADKAAWARRAEANRRGRPDAIVSPNDKDLSVWNPKQVREIEQALAKKFASNHGGVVVLNGGMKLDELAWSESDLGNTEMHEQVRDAVLAVFGVPGTRVGLVTANYATALEQSQSYWRSRIMPLMRERDRAESRIARMWDRNLRVVTDFSDVPALQEDRSARLDRVQKWWMMGFDLHASAAIEGFDSLPEVATDDAADSADMPTGGQAGAVQDLALNGAQIASLLSILAAVSAGTLSTDSAVALMAAAFPAISEDEARRIVDGAIPVAAAGEPPAERAAPVRRDAAEIRGQVWRGYIDSEHAPTERVMRIAMERYLRESAGRVSAALGSLLPEGRSVSRRIEDDLAAIFDLALESRELRSTMGGEILAALRRGFEIAVRSLPPAGLEWDPDRSPIEGSIADLIARVSETTKAAVRRVVLGGLEEGATTQQIQARIMSAPEFGRARALTVARTEATRALNQGTSMAYHDAAANGIRVRKTWVSARDGAVRDEHQEMDGQTVDVGDLFDLGGLYADAPGGFGIAELDINCRCTTIATVED